MNADTITAGAAVLVALIAYWDSRRQNKRLLMPALMFRKIFNCRNAPFSTSVENSGYGTAKIKAWSIRVGENRFFNYTNYPTGKLFRDSVYQEICKMIKENTEETVLNLSGKEELIKKLETTELYLFEPDESLIPKDRTVNLLSFDASKFTDSESTFMHDVLRSINFEITYSDPFDGNKKTISS